MSTSPVWLVTGGSRGIGLAVVRRIVAAGERVAIFSRGDEGPAQAAELGENCMACQVDVADRAAVTEAVAKVSDRWGPIQKVVNNAGVHRGGRVGRLKREDWDAVLSVNLSGALNIVQAVEADMQAGAAIVNVGAVVGFRGFPGDAAYGASKAGLAGLTRSLAIELAPRGITVNLVIPGLVLTEMTGGLSETAMERMRQTIPMGQYGAPEDIAQVVEWVARSAYMTGAFVPVDGGLLSSFGVTG